MASKEEHQSTQVYTKGVKMHKEKGKKGETNKKTHL